MSETEITQETHRKLAVALFNRVWALLETSNRTTEQSDEMVHAAHASRYHWGKIGTPLEFERGEWQISRVYSTLKRPEPATVHALRCLEICEANGIGGFDLAFAYEALARAHAMAGEVATSRDVLSLAKKAAEAIEDDGDRDYTLGEIRGVEGLI